MPRVFKSVDIPKEEKEVRKDYFDRHTPWVICEDTARRGEKFKVKVMLGREYVHPAEPDHYIDYIQLWNRETLLADLRITPQLLGNSAGHVEVDFYIVPENSMNLSAMALCTKHGLWQSDSKEVLITD
jgi:superoxide reductase